MPSSNTTTRLLLVLVLALAALPPMAVAQDKYPSRPIEMVVAFPRGSVRCSSSVPTNGPGPSGKRLMQAIAGTST